MDVSALKAYIQTKKIPNILIFSGPEWEVQKIYINQIVKVTGLESKRVDSIADVVSKFKSTSFVNKDYLYIARDDSEYMQNEKLQELVKQTIGKNMFVLLLTNVDKRLKFYKTYKDSIVDFEPLKPMVLKKYIQKQITLSDKNCDKLMEVCEYDYGRCLLEIDKIKRYTENYYNNDYGADCVEYTTGMKVLRITEDKAFEVLLKDGIIYQSPKDAIFDFVDAVLDHKCELAFNLCEQCKAVGEATLVMISVLYNNAKAVLQVQSCNSKDVSKSTGLTGWQIINAKKHVGKYRNGELIHIMKNCVKCERGIKTGKIEEQFAVDYILVQIL